MKTVWVPMGEREKAVYNALRRLAASDGRICDPDDHSNEASDCRVGP